MKVQFSLLAWISLVTLASCTMPRDGRKLRKITKDWRRSPVFMKGYTDSPLGSTLLTLYENKKFDLSSSGLFTIQFEAGWWEEKQDTITLSFVNSHREKTSTRIAILKKDVHSIYLYDTDTIRMRLLK